MTEEVTSAQAWSTWSIGCAGALAFSSKGVIVKLMYDAYPIDPVEVLCLRFLFALPFFIIFLLMIQRRHPVAWRRGDSLRLLTLGLIGYYFAALLDFSGLQYISAGLERIVIYTYPGFVLVFGALFFGRRLGGVAVAAMLLAYGGVVLAFIGEAGGDWRGVMLVLASAVSFAFFLLLTADLSQRLGGVRLMCCALIISGIFMGGHYLWLHEGRTLLSYPPIIYGYGLILSLLGTVLPAVLLGIGLRRAGAEQMAVIGSAGPIMTIILAWILLDERPGPLQLLGFICAIAGGIWITQARARTLAMPAPVPRCRPGSS